MKFDFVRDYEPAKVEQGLVNEFLLTYRDDDPTSDASGDEDGDEEDIFGEKKAKKSGKGKAFYKNIERKFILKKKRVNVRLLSSSSHSQFISPRVTNTPHRSSTKPMTTNGMLYSSPTRLSQLKRRRRGKKLSLKWRRLGSLSGLRRRMRKVWMVVVDKRMGRLWKLMIRLGCLDTEMERGNLLIY
jgi:hypothetical protein